MKKTLLITLSACIIAIFLLLPVISTIGTTTTTSYPYDVKVQDKLNYKVTTLVKGTTAVSADPFAAGFNLSQGDTFQIEIYSIPFPMNYPSGNGIMVRADKGNLTGATTFDSYGYHLLHTANKSYWVAFVPSFPDQDIGGGVIYHNELQNNNNTVFVSYTLNADNKFEFTFDSNTGLLQTFDWYVSSGSFSHFAFSSVSTGLPGFELPIFVIGIFVTTAIIMHYRRNKM